MGVEVEPPLAETIAEQYRILDIGIGEVQRMSDSNVPRTVRAMADLLVGMMANDDYATSVGRHARLVCASAQGVGVALDPLSVLIEVQGLRAWIVRSIIQQLTQLPDGGALGAEFRRVYASTLVRMRLRLPPARLLDERIDFYTRLTAGEHDDFAWAASGFTAIAVGQHLSDNVRIAVEPVVVSRILSTYLTSGAMLNDAYNRMPHPR